MAKATKDWTSEGCGLTWTICGQTADWYRQAMRANGVASPPPYRGQSAPCDTGEYKIAGNERITLSHVDAATFREVELGAYKSAAEARLAAAAFAYGDASARPTDAVEAAGYVPSRQAGGRSTYAKSDGGQEATIAIHWSPTAEDGRPTGAFVQATIRGRGRKDLHTATILLPAPTSNVFVDGCPWCEGEIASLAVQAAIAVTEARLKARGSRSRAKPLADGEERAFIAPMLGGRR